MARIPFVRHRTANQIRAKYRACRHPVEKTRWHAVWLLARTDEPRTPAQVADLVGLSDVTVRAILHRWNAAGPDGLADGRKGNGSEPKLTPRRRDGPVRRPAEAAAGRRAVDRAEGRPVRPRPVGRGGRPGDRVAVAAGPRVHPPGAPPLPPPGRPTARPAGGGKKLAPPGEAAAGGEPREGGRGVGRGRGPARAQADHPPGVVARGAPAPVVRADEVRVAVRVRVRPTRHRGDVHGDPAAGEGRADGRGPGRVRRPRRPGRGEGAGAGGGPGRVAHGQAAGGAGRTSGSTSCRRVRPELQPVEPFWALVREGVANDTFDRLADLRRVVRRRCRRLAADRATVKGAIGFRWAVNLEA